MAIDPNLQDVVKSIKTSLTDKSVALLGNQQVPWMNFQDVVLAGKFDFDLLHSIFDRTAINTDYSGILQNTSAIAKDMMSAKIAGDYLSTCERDFRMRMRSRVRMFVHAAVNAAETHGSDEGPISKNILDWLIRIESVDIAK